MTATNLQLRHDVTDVTHSQVERLQYLIDISATRLSAEIN